MKVGFYISDLIGSNGGIYSFQWKLFHALKQYQTKHEVVVFTASNEIKQEKFENIKIVHVDIHRKYKPLFRIGEKIVKYIQAPFQRNYLKLFPIEKFNPVNSAVKEQEIELMWFLGGFEYVEVPYVFTLFDLQHRLQPAFPEVSVYGWKWNERENFYYSALARASFVITGTEVGKQEVQSLFKINEERMQVIPMPAPNYDQIEQAQGLLLNNIQMPYLLYPAQFWPHKNHIALLNALKLLKEKYELQISLVLTGDDKGNLSYIKNKILEMGLEKNVHILGFVSRQDLKALYKSAFALVFPSLFGPDNLPPLEAFVLGCPVIAHDMPGSREQFAEAAMLVNCLKEDEIADAVIKLTQDIQKRDELVSKGLAKAATLTTENYLKQVFQTVDKFEAIRRCWSHKGL